MTAFFYESGASKELSTDEVLNELHSLDDPTIIVDFGYPQRMQIRIESLGLPYAVLICNHIEYDALKQYHPIIEGELGF